MSSPRRRPPPGVGLGPGASTTLAAIVVGTAIVLGPVAFAAAIATAMIIARSDEVHWQEVARWAGLAGVPMFFVELVVGLNPLALVYGGLWRWLMDPTLWPPSLIEDFAPSLAVCGPVGVALGAALLGTAQARGLQADWHPLEQRFRAVERGREATRMAAAAADVAAQNACASPPLGVSYDDGDLDALRDGAYVTLASILRRCIGIAIVGEAGSGKTETIKRIIAILGWMNFSVIVCDWKGEAALIDEATAAFISWRKVRRIVLHAFPEEPIKGWLGTVAQLTSRLLGVFQWSEPYYESATRSLIDLLVADGCTSSQQFLSRMTLGYLQKRAANDPTAAAEIESLKNNRAILDGARMRFSGFFRALGGAYDGERGFGESHLCIISVNALAARADSEAHIRMVLNDIMQFATDPARRDSTIRYAVLLDEFSEMADVAAELVIAMAEKMRSAGVLIIVAAQSYEGLGIDDQQRDRLIAALAGGVILHRCQTPERLCERAGTVRLPEQSWQLDATTHSGMGSMREGYRMKLLPDDVRQAGTGEAWVINQGKVAHVQVLQAETKPWMEHARSLHDESRRRGEAARADRGGQRQGPPKLEPPSFLDEL